MQRLILPVLILLIAAQAAIAAEPAITPQAALERLFTADALSEDWFAPLFLQQVTVAQIELIISQVTGSLGAFQSVTPSGPLFLSAFENGDVPTSISLDGEGRILGLFFQPPRLRTSGLEEATAGFSELRGEVSLTVVSNIGELAAIQPDTPLAVGSAFKLAVLAALDTKVQMGELAWDDIVRLEESWRSLPSGTMQDWPVASPVTLHTLATQMISTSDNTATDALISILGREFVEMFSPRNAPFLTTREAFILKNRENVATLERFRQADTAERRAILEEARDLPLPGVETLDVNPVALDIEWYLTTRELCGLMGAVRHLDLMGVNPGLAERDDWARVAFKGGSEPGVLNLTTWLEREDGSFYCVSATWNNEAEVLDDLRFFTLYSTLLETVKGLTS